MANFSLSDILQSIMDGLRPPIPDPVVSGVLGAAQGIGRAAMAPGNAYRSTPDNPVTTEQMIGPAADLAGLLAGQAPLAPAGAAGIFGGRLARTANHENLRLAEAMETGGLPKNQITDATGWFRGADGKWRFEIPDNNLKVTPDKGSLVMSVDHPELFAAYPDIQLMQAQTSLGGGGGHYAYHQSPPMIVARGATPDALRSTTAHELQHVVQHIEGFDPGAHIARRWVPSEGKPDPYEFYRRNMGEVEARNVQKRLDYSPQDRATLRPEGTQSVINQQQLSNPEMIARMLGFDYWRRGQIVGN